tara:strand:+ start:120 stop:317 length:198 start_codon:yes stop_codon:yes gene_type:complete
MLSKQCKAHLEEVGETGLQHMKNALCVAVKLQLLVPAMIVHAFAPRFFTKTGTKVMKDIIEKRNK